jgi:hypothetical protein
MHWGTKFGVYRGKGILGARVATNTDIDVHLKISWLKHHFRQKFDGKISGKGISGARVATNILKIYNIDEFGGECDCVDKTMEAKEEIFVANGFII